MYLRVLPYKREVNQKVSLHVSPAARNSIVLISTFQGHSTSFLQIPLSSWNKLGHPAARRQKQLMQVPILIARGTQIVSNMCAFFCLIILTTNFTLLMSISVFPPTLWGFKYFLADTLEHVPTIIHNTRSNHTITQYL